MHHKTIKIIFTILITLGIWKMANNVQAVSIGTLASGELNPNTYSYYINTGTWEWLEEKRDEDGAIRPSLGSFQIYCTQPGANITRAYNWRLSRAQQEVGKTYYSSCGCASQPYSGYTTPIVFSPGSVRNLPPAAAYIISDTTTRGKTLDKQRGIVNLKTSGIDNGMISGNPNSATYAGSSSYDQEAVWYHAYDNAVRSKNGLNPVDTTNLNSTYTMVNQSSNEYTIGPFSMTYTEGSYRNGLLNFSGITEMSINGYNQNKQLVRTGIKIDKILLANNYGGYNSYQSFDYFTPNNLKVDKTSQLYPKSGQKFYVVFKNPNSGLSENSNSRIEYISIQVKFKYMLANGKYTPLTGTKYLIAYSHNHSYNPHTHWVHGTHPVTRTGRRTWKDADGKSHSETYTYTAYVHSHSSDCYLRSCHGCITTCYLASSPQQNMMAAEAIRSIYEQTFELGKDNMAKLDITMNLGGNVWEDGLGADKESSIDGRNNVGSSNKLLKNIKVTLYTQNGQVAKLLNNTSEGNIMHRVNPTLTDDDGNYLFIGLDAMKKYYVVFEYNGQIYMPTTYNVNWNASSTDWKATSKGTELTSERNSYDNRFASIGSYPNNYQRPDGSYNKTYSNRELMGYTLNASGKYVKTGAQLIDGYLYDANGNQTTTYSANGAIGNAIRNYITQYKSFPTNMETIYSQIAGGNQETLNKLHFIADTLMQSYSKPQSATARGSYDLYPKENQFTVNHTTNNAEKNFTTVRQFQNATYPQTTVTLNGINYKPIYPKMYFINQGLWVRQKADMALRKDVYKATLQVNGKTEIYNYNKRQSRDELWEIAARVSDSSYYGTTYSRELYPAEYQFKGSAENQLNIYVTYQIQLRNQSQSVLTQIDEVVDYYDSTYTYMPNMSWVMYDSVNISEQEYRNIMINKSISNTSKFKNINSNTNTRYASSTKSTLSGYNNIYIRGLQSHQMGVGETAYIYLTFKVNGSGSSLALGVKQNIVEINGYTTYYAGTTLPNYGSRGANTVAGLIDVDSNPGNITSSNYRNEYRWEDDTDRAQGLNILIDNSLVRKMNGTVWEDKRNTGVAGTDAVIGNGIRESGETLISGIGVELYEVINGTTSNTVAQIWNGSSWVSAKTTTKANGTYEFSGYIPGDYIVRFTYGGAYNPTYNGQDFKSTTYQVGINQNGQSNSNTLAERKYNEYSNVNSQNSTATYGYNIYKADSLGQNVSDAKDIWTNRQSVNNYGGMAVTYAKAEILSHNTTPNTNTQMTAETGVIAVEFEYNRTYTDGSNSTSNGSSNYLNGNDKNGKYVLQNVDFGLVERPKAGLELTKKVNNVKITLANSSVLFDAKQNMNNLLWNASKEYNINSLKSNINSVEGKNNNIHNDYTTAEIVTYRNQVNSLILNTQGLIQATMDEEIMHGATIQITYDFIVNNIGEVDYNETSFYYTGKVANANTIVKTSADVIIDYVENNLQFSTNNNQGWSAINENSIKTKGYVNSDVASVLNKYNTMIVTESLKDKKLIPQTESTKLASGYNEATYATTKLILTQLITPENSSDDMNYNNTAEIVQISNDVGRRMAFSVQGNQNPKAAISEIDSARAEKVIILPPFGGTHIYLYICLGVVILTLLTTSIILIKKKILK